MRKLSASAQKALAAQKDLSVKGTRKRLQDALRRLLDGEPAVVSASAPVSASSVAKEAGVDRATLYRFHQPVLEEIRKAAAASKVDKNRARRSLSETEAKLREYRDLVEDAQSEVAALARINYRLDARIHELEELIRIRDQVIADLQLQLNPRSRSTGPTPLKRC
jgi:hypothetical protein